MGDNSLFTILRALTYLSDSIFIGLKIFVPVIFLIKIFRINFRKPDFDLLVYSINLLLLSAGVLFLVTIGSNTWLAWNSGNEFERDFIISIATGPNWFQVVIPILSYGLLPQVMWLRTLRATIFSSFIIVMLWFISYFLILYLSHRAVSIDFPIAEYAEKTVLFIVLLAVFYFIGSRKRKSPGL